MLHGKIRQHQCMLAVRENLMKLFRYGGGRCRELERVIRLGTADISERYLTAIRDTATEYVAGIFRRLREHEYDPELIASLRGRRRELHGQKNLGSSIPGV